MQTAWSERSVLCDVEPRRVCPYDISVFSFRSGPTFNSSAVSSFILAAVQNHRGTLARSAQPCLFSDMVACAEYGASVSIRSSPAFALLQRIQTFSLSLGQRFYGFLKIFFIHLQNTCRTKTSSWFKTGRYMMFLPFCCLIQHHRTHRVPECWSAQVMDLTWGWTSLWPIITPRTCGDNKQEPNIHN